MDAPELDVDAPEDEEVDPPELVEAPELPLDVEPPEDVEPEEVDPLELAPASSSVGVAEGGGNFGPSFGAGWACFCSDSIRSGDSTVAVAHAVMRAMNDNETAPMMPV